MASQTAVGRSNELSYERLGRYVTRVLYTTRNRKSYVFMFKLYLMRIVYPASGIDVDCFPDSVPDSVVAPLVGVSQNNNILATLAQKIVKVTD